MKTPACRRAIGMQAEAFAAGAALAASCASTFLLAETGLLEGRRATTTCWLAPLFRRRYPGIELAEDRMVVARFAGPGLADACARYLLLDQRRSQAPYMALSFMAGQDETIARAEAWARANIARDFAMEELAAAAGLTPRTFARRLAAVCGLSPVRFAQRIRIEAAELLLETTRLSVDEVARRVGYAEPSTLRRLIRRDARRSPAELRRSGRTATG